jgi:GNAT superfamily N-acetyltransferase
LTERGYRLVSFENVLGLALESVPERVTPQGVEVRPSGDDEFEPWLDVVADGVAHPDTQGVPSHEDFPRELVQRAERDFAAAGVIRYVALRDGVMAGGASFRVAEGVAQLTAAATAPAHRRRGVQSALLSARSPTPRPPAATSPSSRPSQRPSLSRTCSGGASTCSIPAPFLRGSPEFAREHVVMRAASTVLPRLLLPREAGGRVGATGSALELP